MWFSVCFSPRFCTILTWFHGRNREWNTVAHGCQQWKIARNQTNSFIAEIISGMKTRPTAVCFGHYSGPFFFFFKSEKKRGLFFFLRCGLVIYVVRKRSLLPVLWSQSCFDSWSTRRFPLFSLSFSPILHSLNAQTWNAVGRRESEFMSSLIPDRQLCGSYLQEKFTPQRSV